MARSRDAVEHGKKQVVQWRFAWEDEVAAGNDSASAAAGQEDRQVSVVVAVAVADPAAVNDHDTVKKRLVTFSRRLEFAQEVGELLDVESVDCADFPLLFGVAAVVRYVVMPVGDSQEMVAPIARLVRIKKSGDSSHIGLKGKGHQVEHLPDMLTVIGRDSRRPDSSRWGPGRGRRVVDAAFQLADRGHVLVDLPPVGFSQASIEAASIVGDQVENTLTIVLRRPRAVVVSAGTSLENSRSKTSLGSTSLAIGMDSDRQEMLEEVGEL